MIFHRYPEWCASIAGHYWHLRYARGFDSARIRKQYRRIEAEKKRLHEAGVDQELLRLYCRHMVNPRNERAASRFWNKHFELLQTSLPIF